MSIANKHPFPTMSLNIHFISFNINMTIWINNDQPVFPTSWVIETYTGWWYAYPSEKYEFVSWDDDIPNCMESHKTPWFQTTKQLINHH